MHAVAPSAAPSRTWPLALGSCLVLALLAHAWGLGGTWLNYDDPRTVLENPAFAGGGVDLLQILDPTQRIADVYLPVTYLSLGLDVALFGTGSATPFLVHSLVLQVLAAFVLVLLLRELGLPLLPALLGAVPLLAHPALVESVAWVSSRKEPLVVLFALLALWLGRRSVHGRARLWLPAACALLACYSKGSAIALPLLAAPLWGLWRGEGWSRRRYLQLLGLVTLLCVLAGVHHWLLARAGGTMGFTAPFAALPASFAHAWGTTLWPSGLAVHHPRAAFLRAAESGFWLHLVVLLGLLALGALLLLRPQRAPRAIGTGLVLFAAAWAPFNAWFPATALPVADRYLQLPLVGFGFVLAGLLLLVRGARAQPVRALLLGVVALVFAALSAQRSADFADSGVLWRANLAVHPDDAIAWINLAEWQRGQPNVTEQELAATTRRAEALADGPYERFRVRQLQFDLANRSGDGRAIVASREALVEAADALPHERPESADERAFARYLLAEALVEEGRWAEATRVLEKLLALRPEHVDGLALLASCTMRDTVLGTPEERVRLAAPLLEAAAAQPGHERSYQYRLAEAERLFLLGDLRARGAIVTLRESGLQPAFSSASRIFALSADVFLSRELVDEAIDVLREGLRRWPRAALLHAKLGQLLYASQRYDDAEQHLREAVTLRPGNERLTQMLGTCLLVRARHKANAEEAKEWAPLVAEAARLVPEHPGLPLMQARLLFAERRIEAALVKAREAVERSPDDPEALGLRAELLSANGYARLLQGRRDEAMRFFRELLESAPAGYSLVAVREVVQTTFVERYERAQRAARAEEWADAEVHLRGALALLPAGMAPFPELIDAHGHLGTVLTRLGRWDEAAEEFGELVRLLEAVGQDPGKAVHYRVIALFEAGRAEEARDFALLYLEGERRDRLRDPALRDALRQELARPPR